MFGLCLLGGGETQPSGGCKTPLVVRTSRKGLKRRLLELIQVRQIRILCEDEKLPPKLVAEIVVFCRVPKRMLRFHDRPCRFAKVFQQLESSGVEGQPLP